MTASVGCEKITEITSESFDLDFVGVGSSPHLGDVGRTGRSVPAGPTLSQDRRYLIRLCGVEIASGYAIIIRGLRQLATIRGVIAATGQVFETEIESPLWTFPDGNISWHLRWQTNRFSRRASVVAQLAATSVEMVGLDTSLLFRPPLIEPYFPLGGGIPPGRAIGALGTFRDMRYPWTCTAGQEFTFSEYIRGPGAVVFYVSVHQTDAKDRVAYPSLPGMRPEDLFVASFPNARYGRVGGAIVYERIPCCEGDGKVAL